MTCSVVLDALKIPEDARLNQRVPKKLLLEHGAPTAADKRKISVGIEELLWVAALKPERIGVPAYRDAVREYLEIAVLTVTLRAEAGLGRLAELIHRAIPYPVLLIATAGKAVSLSLAHQRKSQGEAGSVVLEEFRRSSPLHPGTPNPVQAAFLGSLALASLPKRDLYTLYQGWLDRLDAWEAAAITGNFTLAETPQQAVARREALGAYGGLRREISRLRSQAERERQLSRRVELNLSIKRLEADLAVILTNL